MAHYVRHFPYRGSEEISLILTLSLSKGKDPLPRVIQSEAMNPEEELKIVAGALILNAVKDPLKRSL